MWRWWWNCLAQNRSASFDSEKCAAAIYCHCWRDYIKGEITFDCSENCAACEHFTSRRAICFIITMTGRCLTQTRVATAGKIMIGGKALGMLALLFGQLVLLTKQSHFPVLNSDSEGGKRAPFWQKRKTAILAFSKQIGISALNMPTRPRRNTMENFASWKWQQPRLRHDSECEEGTMCHNLIN